MLAPQAEAFAARGRRVIWADRRGTGGSPRAGWPGGGVAGHADDAAALLRALDAVPATVLGFSSGGVVALALAARHPSWSARRSPGSRPRSACCPAATDARAGHGADRGPPRRAPRRLAGATASCSTSCPAAGPTTSAGRCGRCAAQRRGGPARRRRDHHPAPRSARASCRRTGSWSRSARAPDPLHAGDRRARSPRLTRQAAAGRRAADDHEVYLHRPRCSPTACWRADRRGPPLWLAWPVGLALALGHLLGGLLPGPAFVVVDAAYVLVVVVAAPSADGGPCARPWRCSAPAWASSRSRR